MCLRGVLSSTRMHLAGVPSLPVILAEQLCSWLRTRVATCYQKQVAIRLHLHHRVVAEGWLPR